MKRLSPYVEYQQDCHHLGMLIDDLLDQAMRLKPCPNVHDLLVSCHTLKQKGKLKFYREFMINFIEM